MKLEEEEEEEIVTKTETHKSSQNNFKREIFLASKSQKGMRKGVKIWNITEDQAATQGEAAINEASIEDSSDKFQKEKKDIPPLPPGPNEKREKKGIGRQWGKVEEGESKNCPFSFCV